METSLRHTASERLDLSSDRRVQAAASSTSPPAEVYSPRGRVVSVGDELVWWCGVACSALASL
jgi:hypothetical protein